VLPIGTFDDYYSYGHLLTTNIYTMFRGLIQDFGLIGSVLFMLVTGFLFHLNFHSMLRSRRPAFAVAVFVLMIGYFYTSFISSLLGVNRIYYATFVLLWIVLQINKMRLQMGRRPLATLESRAGVVV
jgi:hypothetical protein